MYQFLRGPTEHLKQCERIFLKITDALHHGVSVGVFPPPRATLSGLLKMNGNDEESVPASATPFIPSHKVITSQTEVAPYTSTSQAAANISISMA